MKKSWKFFPTVHALIGLGLATRPSCATMGESVMFRIECLQTFLSNERCHTQKIKLSNEYCGTLSNGFVLNYRMNIKVNDRMDLN